MLKRAFSRSPTTVERRTADRQLCNHRTVCEVIDHTGEPSPAWVWDISPQGTCVVLEGPQHHAPGEFLNIELRREGDPVPLRIHALVIHSGVCLPNHNEAWMHGTVFVQVLDETVLDSFT
jgi:hypothetical protein